MHPAFISLIASTGSLALLVLFFHVEARRGVRFLPRLRDAFDRAVVAIAQRATRSLHIVRQDVIRQTFHYLLHQLLRFGLSITRFMERRLDWLLHRNRAIARKASEIRVVAGTHSKLREIAKHQAHTTLSESEKQAHKERSIGTKL